MSDGMLEGKSFLRSVLNALSLMPENAAMTRKWLSSGLDFNDS